MKEIKIKTGLLEGGCSPGIYQKLGGYGNVGLQKSSIEAHGTLIFHLIITKG